MSLNVAEPQAFCNAWSHLDDEQKHTPRTNPTRHEHEMCISYWVQRYSKLNFSCLGNHDIQRKSIMGQLQPMGLKQTQFLHLMWRCKMWCEDKDVTWTWHCSSDCVLPSTLGALCYIHLSVLFSSEIVLLIPSLSLWCCGSLLEPTWIWSLYDCSVTHRPRWHAKTWLTAKGHMAAQAPNSHDIWYKTSSAEISTADICWHMQHVMASKHMH